MPQRRVCGYYSCASPPRPKDGEGWGLAWSRRLVSHCRGILSMWVEAGAIRVRGAAPETTNAGPATSAWRHGPNEAGSATHAQRYEPGPPDFKG